MGKLLDSLKILSRKEFRSFGRYIHSPYFCRHQETIRLMDFLQMHYPDFKQDTFEGFRATYQNESLSLARYHVLKTYLYNHLMDFLAQERFQQSPLKQQHLRVDHLRQMGQYKTAEKYLETAWKYFSQEEALDSSNYGDNLQLHELKLDLVLSMEKRSGELPLRTYFQALDEQHLGQSLKYLLLAWTVHKLFNIEFPEDRWKNCQEAIESSSSPQNPLTMVFYHLLRLIRGNTGRSHLTNLQTLLDQHGERFSRIELVNVYGYLQNHFTNRVQAGDPEALKNLYDVYQKMDSFDLIFGRGEFSGHMIRNITIVGCRLQQQKTTRDFLLRRADEIKDELGGNAYAFSLAYLDFYDGEYRAALLNLQKLEFIDPFYRTGHQVLQLRIYYELEEYESLTALSETFRRYLNRTPSISDTRKDLSRNFVSVLRQLALAREQGPELHRLQKIRNFLDQGVPMSDQTWLNEKWMELHEQST